MPRNLERRVELLFPIWDRHNQALLDYFFSVYFADNVKAFEMQPDGSWRRKTPQAGELPVRAQEALHRFFEQQATDWTILESFSERGKLIEIIFN